MTLDCPKWRQTNAQWIQTCPSDFRLALNDFRLALKDFTIAPHDFRLAINDFRLAPHDFRLAINECRLTLTKFRLALKDFTLALKDFRLEIALFNSYQLWWKGAHMYLKTCQAFTFITLGLMWILWHKMSTFPLTSGTQCRLACQKNQKNAQGHTYCKQRSPGLEFMRNKTTANSI